jgi:glycosyltransferase involved in cell wall biosynthesis
MSRPSISVVIPTYNSGHLVVDAIDHALNQTDPADEIIVIDDGSTDDTASRLAHYGDRIRLAVQPNGGVSSARNHGIRLASSDYVAFCDADDVWHSRKLEFQRKALVARPDLGILGCLMFDWPAPSFPEWTEAEAEVIEPISWNNLLFKNTMGTSAKVIQKSLLEKLGGFDLTLRSAEDRDLWLQIAEIAPVACLPVFMVGCRRVEGSLSNQIQSLEKRFTVLRKIDARRAWRGKWLLRRKAYGYAYFGGAYQQSIAEQYGKAFISMFLSFWYYPLPFSRDEVKTPFARLKSLVVFALRMLRIKSPEPRGFTAKIESPGEGSKVVETAG